MLAFTSVQRFEIHVRAHFLRQLCVSNLLTFCLHFCADNGLLGYAQMTEEVCSKLISKLRNRVDVEEIGTKLSQIREWCTSVLSSSGHMLDILDNVLDLSKLESQTIELNNEPLNLWSLCNEIRLLLLPTKHENVHLIIDIEPELWILGDGLRWRQV